MICGHCQSREVSVGHVRACANVESRVRSIGRFEVNGPALQTQPRPEPSTLATRATNGEDIEGFYERDGHYYKVVQSENTGNWYALEGEPHEGEKIEWEYAGRRPLHHLTAANRLTAEEAARLGHLTGRCVFCSRKLTRNESLAVGYGPDCAANNGLPWGEKELVPAESPYAEAPEWTI